MDRDTARQEIRRNWRQIMQGMTKPAKKKVNGEQSYICPLCDNGSGSDGDGITRNPKSQDGTGLKCFKCGFSGDIIDLYMKVTQKGYNEALSLLANEMGLAIDRPTAGDDFKPDRPYNALERPQTVFSIIHDKDYAQTKKTAQNEPQKPTEASVDFGAYYVDCCERLNAPEVVSYLERRGISLETAAKYLWGYDPKSDPANAPGAMGNAYRPHPCPRLIIPVNESYYVARRIDGKKAMKYINPKGCQAGIFNESVLYTQDVQEVFVFEGAFDALSVIEAGYDAIALNSASNFDKLVKQLEQRRTDATLILCPDNDNDPKTAEAVKRNFATLSKGLQRLNISHITADINGEYKDANEHLVGNKKSFIDSLGKASWQASSKPDNTSYYIDSIMTGEIERFKDEKTTGFFNLDAKAGGLYSGIYVLAAVPSLGKTTLAAQIADQLAENGHDVIFFSLEQSRLEIVSKSIARRIAKNDMQKAVTSLSIRKGYLPKQVLDAAAAYKKAIGDRLSIVEGNFCCDIIFIGDYVRQYVRRNETRPVVFIDYLQILQPAEDEKKQSTKEIVDKTITELKRISRELDLTIIVISSVNRTNYLTPIDFESLKESGGVEYTADVVWGLQFGCLNEDIFEKQKNIKERRERIKKAKAENPRKIELVCLKNRYGVASYSCFFDYYPACDLFKEDDDAKAVFLTDTPKAGRTAPKVRR